MDWKSILGGVAPTLATALSVVGGPAGMVAGAALRVVSSAVFGHPDGTSDQVTQAIQNGLSPDAITALQKADNDFKVQMAQITAATDQASIKADSVAISDINTTIQTEAKADHWPTYSWRPFVGFCFGLLGVASGVTVAGAYVGVMFFHTDPSVLAQLPGMLGAEAAVMATMAPVLGIASFFRGKMQSNPNLPTDNRG
jgi:hypothetical protein